MTHPGGGGLDDGCAADAGDDPRLVLAAVNDPRMVLATLWQQVLCDLVVGNPEVDGGKLGSVYTSVAEHLLGGPPSSTARDRSCWRRDEASRVMKKGGTALVVCAGKCF